MKRGCIYIPRKKCGKKIKGVKKNKVRNYIKTKIWKRWVLDVLSLTSHSRAISVILGDKWKKMKNEERRMYTMEAKALAEEQKRLNPDCWKRKRTNSVSHSALLFLLLLQYSSFFPKSRLYTDIVCYIISTPVFGFSHVSILLYAYYWCCLLPGFPADLNHPPESPAAGGLALERCWTESNGPLDASLLSCILETQLWCWIHLLFVTFKHYRDKPELWTINKTYNLVTNSAYIFLYL